jgi:hypothetical protein
MVTGDRCEEIFNCQPRGNFAFDGLFADRLPKRPKEVTPYRQRLTVGAVSTCILIIKFRTNMDRSFIV